MAAMTARDRFPRPPRDHGPADLEQKRYDVVVLGAGSTGENVASRAHAGGLSVLVVESELVGGDCSYWACMPSKALLRPVEALSDARSIAGAEQALTGTFDTAAVLARRDSFTSGWSDDGQVQWLDGEGLAFVRGHARLTGDREVEVTGPDGDRVTVHARVAVAVCTGSAPAIAPIAGLDDVGAWDSRDATSADTAPGRLLVVGGGVVGVEMATAWAALGSRVTLLAAEDRLLAKMEPRAGELVRAALDRRGVTVRTQLRVEAVRRDPDDGDTSAGTVTVTLSGGEVLEGDEVLVAAGRRPRTDDIGLESVGLEPGATLTTDDSLRVRGVEAGWLYAAGDCTGRALLTHMGKYQARVCGDAIVARSGADASGADASGAGASGAGGSGAGGGADEVGARPWTATAASADHTAVPQVVFTDPPAASVGLTAAQARDAGMTVRVVEQDLGSVAGAVLYADGYEGWACIVVDEERRVVVGATFVGPGVTELLHAATVAVVGEVSLDRLWHAVPAYPTISEVWLRLLETYGL